jgi:hypothetical protein
MLIYFLKFFPSPEGPIRSESIAYFLHMSELN